MTTEELRIKISADTSDLKKSIGAVKQDIAGLGADAQRAMGAGTSAAANSVQELKDSVESLRNLQFFDLFISNFDKIKTAANDTKASMRNLGSTMKIDLRAIGSVWADWAKGIREIDGGMWENTKHYAGVTKELLKDTFDAAKGAAQDFGAATKEALASINTTAAKVAGTLAALATLSAAITNTFSTAQNIKALNAEAQKVGLSVNAYQEWAYVLERTGVEASELTGLIKGLTDQQKEVRYGSEDVTRAFGELGMSAEKVINMTQEELFRTTIAQLQKVTDEVERTSLAYQIFGEDAAHIANLLRLTNQETSDMAAQVHLLGATISGDFLAKSVTLANSVANLRLAWQGLTNTLAELLMPVITKIVDALTKAIVIVNLFLKTVFGLEIAPASSSSSVGSATGGIDSYTESVDAATGAVEKLKRTTMGFDELNIVANPNSSSGGSGGSGGAGGGVGGDLMGGLSESDSIFSKAQKDIEAFQEKVKAFLEEWKTEIQIISAALGTLAVAGLLKGLGNAIGLGEQFLGVLTTIQKVAGTVITVVLQYSLVNEFMDNYINGEGFKEYLKGLFVAALGTGILYAMWGPTGLVIGLAVTAAASIKAVIDNGGIDSVESAVVALTGLASAIGAITVAWKNLGLAKLVGEFGAFVALLKEGHGLAGTLAAAFPKATNALSAAATAIASVVGGLSAATVAAIVAALAGVASAAYYLYENWELVKDTVVRFFEINIVPKLNEIKESFQKILDAVVSLGGAIWDALPKSWKDFLSDVAGEIKNVVKAIGEWFESVDWLKGIGKAFEAVGGIIVHVVSSVIAGAMSSLVGIFQGAIQTISGSVQIVAGVVEAIIKLLSGDLQGAVTAVKKIGDGIYDVFVGMYNATIGVVINFVDGVIDWFIALYDELVGHSIVPDMIDAIVEWFHSLPTKIFGKLEEFVKGVIQKFQNMWNNVSSATTTKLAEIRTTIINAWNNIKSYFDTNIAPKFTLSFWQNKFDTMRAAMQEKLGAVRTQVMNSWNAIKSYFTQNIAPKFTLSYWKGKFDVIRASISEKLEAARTTIINAWNNIKSYYNQNIGPKFTVSFWKGKFDTIKDGARAAMNGVISVVEGAVNGIVKKVNTVSWKIPSWVPKYGGTSFGFNLKTISIPRLAEGGIAVSSTLANIGENGREAVLPLENNTGWMDMLADRIAARSNTPSKIVLKVGEREIGWAAINGINNVTKQTGGLQLQLV